MSNPTSQERAIGAIMGAFIGDALALGPHWYYDLNEMRKDYGEWVDDYTDPKPHRYHPQSKAGELSQAGYILKMMIESLIACNGYDENDFCRRVDQELFPQLNGLPVSGPGGYTSQSIRESWRRRVIQKLPWNESAGHADTTEALERGLAIAIRYAFEPKKLAMSMASNTRLTQADDIVGSMSVAFGAVLALLIQGHPFDAEISTRLMQLVKTGELPFHAVTQDNLKPPQPSDPGPSNEGLFASPDALFSPSYMIQAAKDPDIIIEPAWKVSIVYGMPCAIYHQLPAAYYLAARFSEDFESGILHALNGGGQNQVRAILTGTLIGAQVGINGMPARLREGLKEKELLVKLATDLSAAY